MLICLWSFFTLWLCFIFDMPQCDCMMHLWVPMCQVIIWLWDRMMRFQSKTHISPFHIIESPVAQWLEHLARSCKVMGWSLIWNLDFFSDLISFLHFMHVVLIILTLEHVTIWTKWHIIVSLVNWSVSLKFLAPKGSWKGLIKKIVPHSFKYGIWLMTQSVAFNLIPAIFWFISVRRQMI